MSANDMLNPLHNVEPMKVHWKSLSKKDRVTNQFLFTKHHKLSWYEGSEKTCPNCHVQGLENSIFYVLDNKSGSKIKTLRQHFPKLRLQAYCKNVIELPQIPANISCPWSDHGKHCAYKNCLSMCVDYCKAY